MDAVSLGHDLAALLNALPEGVLKVDPHWVVVYMNSGAERLLGVTRADLQGSVFWNICDWFPVEFVLAAKATEAANSSCQYQRGGAWTRVEITVIDHGDRLIQVRDVTNQVQDLERETARRNEAENSLEASQEFLQAVLDNIEAGIVACDETGTLKLFNNALRALHGVAEMPVPPEEWPARYHLYYPDGITLLRKEDTPLYRAFSGEAVRNVEILIAPKDGQRRNLLASGRALIARDGRKLGAVVAMNDITHRKQSSARLRQALRQFRALFHDAPIAYHEIDREGIIRRVNRAECRLLGRARHELIGRPIWEFVPESERESSRTALFERLSGARPLEPFEREYITPSGRRVVMEIHENLISNSSSQITGLRGAMLDVTDRTQRQREKLAREQAEAASAETRNILERIGDAYMAFDAEWRYQYLNTKAAELALKPASELIGRCVWDEFPESVNTPFFSELQRAMREQVPVEFVHCYAPLGKWFENSVYPSPSGVGVYYRDVTERMRTQIALEKRTAELAMKNADLEMFAYVASHDLQEPLRITGTYANLLATRFSGVLDAEGADFLSFIVQGVKRMERLIQGVLALCRLDSADAVPPALVNVEDVVSTVCGNLHLLIEDTGAVVIREDLPAVRFSETQLLQVMQNLIGNALRYRSEAPPRIAVSAEREALGWRVSVSDNGIGFAMRHADQIFKPFKRLRGGEDGGTGIGLAICKKIIESRGGRIWAESTPGVGSMFSFTVPDALPAGD
jgi:PAS domain S-box-containing protein